jgi:hypothetical protein
VSSTSGFDVTLGGKGYLVDLETYRRRSAPIFVSRQAEGAPAYGDLATGGTYSLDGFAGHGQVAGSEGDRYRWGAGIDVHTAPGSARIGAALGNVGAAAGFARTGFRALAVWRGSLWLGTDAVPGTVYEWDGATLTLRDTLPAGAGAITCLVPFLDRLCVANDANGVVRSSGDGTAWATSFTLAAGCTGICVLVVGPGASRHEQDMLNAEAEGIT